MSYPDHYESRLHLLYLPQIVELFKNPEWSVRVASSAGITCICRRNSPAKREELLQAMAHGSAAAWGHLNLLGEYDFSEDKLQDSVGISPQN
jgi:hypothetical protein